MEPVIRNLYIAISIMILFVLMNVVLTLVGLSPFA